MTRQTPVQIIVDGEEYRSATQAARAFNMPKNTVLERVRVYGWTWERALKTPPNANVARHRALQVDAARERTRLSAHARRLVALGITDGEGGIIL